MNITVVGSGGWGTALALVLLKNGHRVSLWCRREDKCRQMQESRENPVLPGVELPGELLLSLDTWERECRLYRQPPLSHLLRLLAHGMAHMTGLDHGPEMAALEQLCLQSPPESIPIRA